jgi:hypothetical protein
MRKDDDLPIGKFISEQSQQASPVVCIEACNDVIKNEEFRFLVEYLGVNQKQNDT